MKWGKRIGTLAGALLLAGIVVPWIGVHQPANAATIPGPTLTVVGYGIVTMNAPTTAGPQQLQITFQTEGSNGPNTLRDLNKSVTAARIQLEKAGVSAKAFSTEGPPNLSYNNVQYQANVTLEVTFPTLTRLADAMQASGVQNDANVQNTFVNQVTATPTPTAAQLSAGYRAAFANALTTAQQMAQADNLTLGHSVSVYEGSANTISCNPMNGCTGISSVSPPSVGQNQELVAVTITYDTSK
ncbi:MAG: hypothetical protein C7B45_15735 [Sulfobacillus acidophilus]|uniref:SIMPL domain-containing protein n=1 Tax=Sulfobacillus acidophilus TaxID=53633 RepID=A0A2T2WDE2_9FIRM|nr:MAG: hypothetical protein C7B45_15735 [Sulfobacillus acidophilus]